VPRCPRLMAMPCVPRYRGGLRPLTWSSSAPARAARFHVEPSGSRRRRFRPRDRSCRPADRAYAWVAQQRGPNGLCGVQRANLPKRSTRSVERHFVAVAGSSSADREEPDNAAHEYPSSARHGSEAPQQRLGAASAPGVVAWNQRLSSDFDCRCEARRGADTGTAGLYCLASALASGAGNDSCVFRLHPAKSRSAPLVATRMQGP
jgi:hypothetical protein